MSKDKITAEVLKASKAITNLTKAFEKYGGALEAHEVSAVFQHLNSIVSATFTSASAVAKAKSFSFEALEKSVFVPQATMIVAAPFLPPLTNPVLPGTLKIEYTGEKQPSPVLPAPSTDWKKPTGRISKNSPNKELAGQITHTQITTPAISAILDAGAGVTFLDPISEN